MGIKGGHRRIVGGDSAEPEGLNQAGSIDDLQHRGLQSRPASLVMRREPTLYDARPDTMAKKFADRKQSGWPGSHDQDGGCRCALLNLTRAFVERTVNARGKIRHGCLLE